MNSNPNPDSFLIHAHCNLHGLGKYYDVPLAAVPVIESSQKSNEDADRLFDEYAEQRTRDNVDEY